jgi:hypothetical protein
MEIVYRCISPDWWSVTLERSAEVVSQHRQDGWSVIPTTLDQWRTKCLLEHRALLNHRAESHLLRNIKHSIHESIEEQYERILQALLAYLRDEGFSASDLARVEQQSEGPRYPVL